MFLTEARRRKSHDPQLLESVGPEHCVVGCATVMRLSNKPGSSADMFINDPILPLSPYSCLNLILRCVQSWRCWLVRQ